jgi:toxin secretion/phage lysis holin
MIADYITGLMVAFVFHKSTKTESGGASSAIGFRGIVKKLCILMLIVLAVRLDKMSHTHYIRSAVIFFFMGNEGLSILENLGLMGVPYPEFMHRALEAMKEKGNRENEG